MRTLDLTPTWTEVLGLLLAVYETGKGDARTQALAELRRMAQAADSYNELIKKKPKEQKRKRGKR